MARTRKKNATPKRPTKSGVRGRGTYTGRRGAARGNGGGGAGDPGFAEVAGGAAAPPLGAEAPPHKPEKEGSLFSFLAALPRARTPCPCCTLAESQFSW